MSFALDEIYYKNNDYKLNLFIADRLQTNKNFQEHCHAATDELVRILENRSGLNVAEVFKGGSLGKGTAIRELCDLDLVVFLNGLKTVRDFKYKLPDILNELERAVESWTYRGFINKVKKRHTHVLTVEASARFEGEFFKLQVDIVPAWKRTDKETSYREMRRLKYDDHTYYNSSFSKLQKEFVSHLPPKVKDLIRLVKYWRKISLRDNVHTLPKPPNSYALELVTIHVWERFGSPDSFEMDKLLDAVLKTLVEPASINVSWTRFYDARKKAGKRVRGKPYILDPANPFNNIGIEFVWDDIAQMALETLNSGTLVLGPQSRLHEIDTRDKVCGCVCS